MSALLSKGARNFMTKTKATRGLSWSAAPPAKPCASVWSTIPYIHPITRSSAPTLTTLTQPMSQLRPFVTKVAPILTPFAPITSHLILPHLTTSSTTETTSTTQLQTQNTTTNYNNNQHHLHTTSTSHFSTKSHHHHQHHSMNIDIYSDFQCPFCWIGTQNLKVALEMLDLGTPEERRAAGITITPRAFLLDPSGPLSEEETQGRDYYQQLEMTKGWKKDRVTQIFSNVVHQGKTAGLEFNFDKVKNAGSRRGHLILGLLDAKYKDQDGLDILAVEEKLFQAYFRDGVDFKDPKALLSAAGLDDSEKPFHLTVEELEAGCGLIGGKGKDSDPTPTVQTAVDQFRADLETGRKMGISGVPLFVFNGTGSVSGAQPPDVLAMTIKKMMKK